MIDSQVEEISQASLAHLVGAKGSSASTTSTQSPGANLVVHPKAAGEAGKGA